MHCHLLLPGLYQEVAAHAQCPPALLQLLRHAVRRESFDGDAHAWLCRFFGVSRQRDWPLAPFAFLAEEGRPGDAFWFNVTPVHLLLHRDSFVLADETFASLPAVHARQLVETLNAHFAADGLQFSALQPNRWYLRVSVPPLLQTESPLHAVGRSIQPFLPQGADALRWHGWLNEAQMLLHGHPVNRAREDQGFLPVNSVWPWGGGVLPVCGDAAPQAMVWSGDPVARGLALAHGCAAENLPPSAQDWLNHAESGKVHMLMLDALSVSDPAQALLSLDESWFSPLLAALRDGRIGRLTLHLAGTRMHDFELTRGELLKFWRRAPSWESCLG